jgi:hypothetical protein
MQTTRCLVNHLLPKALTCLTSMCVELLCRRTLVCLPMLLVPSSPAVCIPVIAGRQDTSSPCAALAADICGSPSCVTVHDLPMGGHHGIAHQISCSCSCLRSCQVQHLLSILVHMHLTTCQCTEIIHWAMLPWQALRAGSGTPYNTVARQQRKGY